MSPLAQTLLALAPYLVPPLAGLVVLLVQNLIARLPAPKRAFVESVVRTEVAAAEQALGDLNGPGKKQAVLEAVKVVLAQFHMSVPDSVISGLIEETVLALNSLTSAAASSTTPPAPASGAR